MDSVGDQVDPAIGDAVSHSAVPRVMTLVVGRRQDEADVLHGLHGARRLG